MSRRGESAYKDLTGIGVILRCVFPYKPYCPRKVFHGLIHNGCAHKLVGRVCHDKTVVAEFIKPFSHKFAFRRHHDSIAAARKDKNAGMGVSVINKVRP